MTQPGGDTPVPPPIAGARPDGRPLRIVEPYRVRFDEAMPGDRLRSSGFLRYIQDCAWAHSARLGYGRDWYADRGLAWLVRGIDLEIRGDAPLYGTLDVSTEVVGWRRIMARRLSEVRDAAGALVATGRIDWVLVNDAGVPTRLPPEFTVDFGVAMETFEPLKVALPPTPDEAVRLPTVVRRQDLDPMAHVNNTVYLDYVEEAIASAGDEAAASLARLPRRYQLEYLAPAIPGATLVGATWPNDGARAYRLTDEAGTEMLRARFSA